MNFGASADFYFLDVCSRVLAMLYCVRMAEVFNFVQKQSAVTKSDRKSLLYSVCIAFLQVAIRVFGTYFCYFISVIPNKYPVKMEFVGYLILIALLWTDVVGYISSYHVVSFILFGGMQLAFTLKQTIKRVESEIFKLI